MKLLFVVGARPNFMKVAPLLRSAKARGHDCSLVHTGQHYDENMSGSFFRDLQMPRPDRHLEVGSGTHAQMTAKVMIAFEPVVEELRPDAVVVVGDVNSTVACTLVCSKLLVPVAHVEAGLRSWDREMPEEVNRLVTDCLADLLLTPSPDGDDNLLREGVAPDRIVRVGNVMIDALKHRFDHLAPSDICERLQLPAEFGVVTLHRPSNVDDPDVLGGILGALEELARDVPLVFPCHPRTRARLGEAAEETAMMLTEPLGYLDFTALVQKSRIVLTDSGGLQEETTWHQIPCVTIRENTERPITISQGSNVLAGTDPAKILSLARAALAADPSSYAVPDMWDGGTADRVVAALEARWS